MSEKKPYEDIIHLSRPTPKNHPRMSRLNRAAQFAPFAALTGYEDAIDEAGRRTDERIDLSESEIEELNQKYAILQEHLKEEPLLRITYFVEDERKAGGSYQVLEMNLKQIDTVFGVLIGTRKEKVLMQDIYDIQGEIFGSDE